MPIVPITDLDDPRIAIYRSLKTTNQTRDLDQFVVEGEKLVDRLMASRFPLVSILVTDRYLAQHPDLVITDVSTYEMPFEWIHKLVGFPFHRGVLACGLRVGWPSCEEIARQAGRRLTLVVCPRLSNPENLGAIAGSAMCSGSMRCWRVRAVRTRFPDGCSASRWGRSSACPCSSRIGWSICWLGSNRTSVWNSGPRWLIQWPWDSRRIDRPDRLGLVLGDEDQGVAPDWLARCRRSVTIPMRQGAGSLNVSVAAGILLHHLCRP